MSKITAAEVANGANYADYDELTAIEWASPTVLKCGLCLGATVIDHSVALKITAKTPFGSFAKTFAITKNINFSWAPTSRIKLDVSISDYHEILDISFQFAGKACFKFPIVGWKCLTVSHRFHVPHKLGDAISDDELVAVLALHALESNTPACNNC